jgi:hypothetical protein
MSFQSEVAAAAKRINSTVEQVGRNVVLEWFNDTVESTPVDDGRLQGNWQISKGSPRSGKLDRTGKTAPKADIRALVHKPANYWLVNNLPYATVVEYGRFGTGPGKTDKTTATGFSVQAPHGMARINLIRARRKLRANLR